MAVFGKDLGTLSTKTTETRVLELADYISYMQQCIEDFAAVANSRIRTLETKVKELENNG